MASAAPAPLKSAPLQPQDWVRAASARLAQDGIEAVRVEVLARDLGVSKGSFYWHFRDREEMLSALLTQWEEQETAWLNAGGGSDCSAAARWAVFVERGAAAARSRFEAALHGWARHDARVATRVAAIENRRRAFIAEVLEDVGFPRDGAESWAEIALLLYLGWLDRSTRDAEFNVSGPGLGEFLSELVLAASARLPSASR